MPTNPIDQHITAPSWAPGGDGLTPVDHEDQSPEHDRYRVTIRVEEAETEDPTETSPFIFRSFNRRHHNFIDPDSLDSIDCADVLGYLSYSEHGLCEWRVAGTAISVGIDHWDHVAVAGVVLARRGDYFDQAWWDGLTEDQRVEIMADTAESYTAWCNGWCYWFQVDAVSVCACCGAEMFEHVDACGGFIGLDHDESGLMETVRDMLPEGVDVDDDEQVEMVTP